ncbi:hypothetical protein [Neisseria subflava]|uniref:hypothetical protein n=1 Tax=Neisseria subflava TaxID=28449 RepID=UPI000D31E303|nr:hypothetical protein [Neisseria subflava]
MKNRFLFKNQGPDDEVLVKALRYAIEVSSKSNDKNIHLVLPQKSNFESTNLGKIIDQIFGAGSAKKLCKGETIGNLDFILPSKVSFNNSSGTILAIYCTPDDMNKIESNSSANSIIFVSWLLEEADIWESTWYNNGLNIVHGEPSQQIEILPEEITSALKRLTSIVNLSTGLTHPLDKKHAQRIFHELQEKGCKADEQAVANWAIANGWNARHLDDLKKLTKRYLS